MTCRTFANRKGISPDQPMQTVQADLSHFFFFSRCIKTPFYRASPTSTKPLPNDKFFEETKLKAFSDGILSFAKMTVSPFDRVENTMVKGENAGSKQFLLYPECFPEPSSLGSLKVGICVVKSSTT